MSMHREYEAHFNGELYKRPPAEGTIVARPSAMPAVLGGHTFESAPDLRVEPAQLVDKLRQGVLARLHAGGRMVPSLDPAHFGPGPGYWLSVIEGSRVGGGVGGHFEGLEARFIAVGTDDSSEALSKAWASFAAAALAEITPSGRQRQAEHDAEMTEARAREEMDRSRSALATGQMQHAMTLASGHGRR